jgi:hypothetical protein
MQSLKAMWSGSTFWMLFCDGRGWHRHRSGLDFSAFCWRNRNQIRRLPRDAFADGAADGNAEFERDVVDEAGPVPRSLVDRSRMSVQGLEVHSGCCSVTHSPSVQQMCDGSRTLTEGSIGDVPGNPKVFCPSSWQGERVGIIL